MYEELDRVLLDSDIEAVVLEVFDKGDAYLVEYPTPDGSDRYDTDLAYASSIVKKVGHVGD